MLRDGLRGEGSWEDLVGRACEANKKSNLPPEKNRFTMERGVLDLKRHFEEWEEGRYKVPPTRKKGPGRKRNPEKGQKEKIEPKSSA